MDSIKTIVSKWRYGPWKTITIGYVAVCLLSGAQSAWGDRDFVSSFILWSVTHALYLPILFGCLGTALWVGVKSHEKTGYKTIGWVLGIAALFAAFGLLTFAMEHFPGIGWRFRLVLDTANSDY